MDPIDVFSLRPLEFAPPPSSWSAAPNPSPPAATTPLAFDYANPPSHPLSDQDPPSTLPSSDHQQQQSRGAVKQSSRSVRVKPSSGLGAAGLKRSYEGLVMGEDDLSDGCYVAGGKKKASTKKAKKGVRSTDPTTTAAAARPKRANLPPNQAPLPDSALFVPFLPRNTSLDIFASPPPSSSFPLFDSSSLTSSAPPSSSNSVASTSTVVAPAASSSAALANDVIRIRLPLPNSSANPSSAPSSTSAKSATAATKAKNARGASTKKVGGFAASRRGAGGALYGGGPGKGKGREVDSDLSDQEHMNNDHCEACRGIGRFLCCDGCPRSFHFSCLEPPLTPDQVPEDQWYCTDCSIRKKKIEPPRQARNIFGPLIQLAQTSNPTQYQLPAEVRSHFKGVSTASNGGFVNADAIRPPKIDRRGFAEDRDAFRLKDLKGNPVLCYECGGGPGPVKGANEVEPIPLAGSVGVEVSRGRPIMSCDYCSLHWHYDCLDPPLAHLPMPTQKWMCPNHVDHVFTKPRVPKGGLPTEDITSLYQFNNGNIEIISAAPPTISHEEVEYDEVIINAKKYRVPETTVRLDFWHKILGLAPPKPPPTAKSKQLQQKTKPGMLKLKTNGVEGAAGSMPPTLASAGLDRSGSMSPLTSLGSESPASMIGMDLDEVPPLELSSSVQTASEPISLPLTNTQMSLNSPQVQSNPATPSDPRPPSSTHNANNASSSKPPSVIAKKITLRLGAGPKRLGSPSSALPANSSSFPSSVNLIESTASIDPELIAIAALAASTPSTPSSHPPAPPPPSTATAPPPDEVAPAAVEANGNVPEERVGVTPASLTPAEIQKLMAIHELIQVKGEEALIAFLHS